MTLTVDDARNLMPSRHQEVVLEVIENSIRQAAAKDKNTVNIPYSPEDIPEEVTEWFESAPNLGYKNPNDRESNPVMKALKVMEELGFQIDFYYEANQFVDMGYKISW